MTRRPHYPFDPRHVAIVPRRRRRRYRFHWELFALAALVLIAIYALNHIQCHSRWEDIMDVLSVKNHERYTQLAVWGVTLCGVAAIFRILRSGKEKE